MSRNPEHGRQPLATWTTRSASNEPTHGDKHTPVEVDFVERLHTSQKIFRVVLASEIPRDDVDGVKRHQKLPYRHE